MTLHLGDVPAGSTLYIPFASYDSNGASVTLSGLATTDIEIYKNGSTTQRASDNGYALLDTDGIDFDGITGLHGFSVDLSDNTTSGFYSVGGFFWVVVSAVTIDGQTVNFIAATFRIVAAEGTAGYPKVDTHLIENADATNTLAAAVPSSDITAIKAKTDNLPSDPADQSALEALIDDLPTNAELTAALAGVSDDTADAVWDEVIEGSYTARHLKRLMAAVLLGKVSGAQTTSVSFRSADDSVTRVTTTIDSGGNRTAVALNES